VSTAAELVEHHPDRFVRVDRWFAPHLVESVPRRREALVHLQSSALFSGTYE
jgi:hypothetical protein